MPFGGNLERTSSLIPSYKSWFVKFRQVLFNRLPSIHLFSIIVEGANVSFGFSVVFSIIIVEGFLVGDSVIIVLGFSVTIVVGLSVNIVVGLSVIIIVGLSVIIVVGLSVIIVVGLSVIIVYIIW